MPAVAPAGPLQFEDLKARCARPQWHLNPNMNVFSDPGLGGGAAEQFRTLRSRLYQLRDTQAIRTLLVTSPVPGDGKTFVTNNLAQSIVRQPDRRVLMIDGDLRASRLHIPLGAPKVPGLSDYLSGELDEAASHTTRTGQRPVFYSRRKCRGESERIAFQRPSEAPAGTCYADCSTG